MSGEASFAAVYGFGLIPATYNDYFDLPADIVIAAPDWLTLVTYAFLHARLLASRSATWSSSGCSPTTSRTPSAISAS